MALEQGGAEGPGGVEEGVMGTTVGVRVGSRGGVDVRVEVSVGGEGSVGVSVRVLGSPFAS